MKICILIILLVFSECKKSTKNSDESSEAVSSSSDEVSDDATSKLSSISLDTLKKSLRLMAKEENFIKNKFNISAMELIRPRTDKEMAQLKICDLKSNLKSQEIVQVTIKKNSRIKSWFKKDQDKTLCASDIKSDQSLIPIEYHVSKEFGSKPRFIKFYTDESLVSSYKDKKSSLILTYQYLKNSVNLREWFNEKKSGLNWKEMEKNLKVFFSQMHSALSALLEKKFVYTDFKPENILINKNNKKGSAYLGNLSSVVSVGKSNKLERICVMTPEYFPPVTGSSESDFKQLARSFLKSEKKASNRILSWQFCMSIFSLICQEFEDKRKQFADRSVFDKWKNENTSINKYFKCSKANISKSLASLFDSCLIKKTNNNSIKFEKILQHEWFNKN